MDYRSWFPQNGRPQTPNEPIRPGQPFPIDVRPVAPANGKPVAVGIVSLYCAHCIDMLPSLVEEIRVHRIPFMLVSNGSPQENANMAAFFKAAFPVISLPDGDALRVFGVAATPYFFFVRDTGIVADGFQTDEASQFAARWLSFGRRRV